MALPERSPPFDVSPTVSYPPNIDPTTTDLADAAFNNPMPTNTQIEPTEAFSNSVKDVIDAITFLAAFISYKPEMVLLQLVELRQ